MWCERVFQSRMRGRWWPAGQRRAPVRSLEDERNNEARRTREIVKSVGGRVAVIVHQAPDRKG